MSLFIKKVNNIKVEQIRENRVPSLMPAIPIAPPKYTENNAFVETDTKVAMIACIFPPKYNTKTYKKVYIISIKGISLSYVKHSYTNTYN